jgi:hypothetical protein
MMNNILEEDYQRIADMLNVEVATLKAVQEVETGGRGGFFAPGKPAILFEGHIFWNQLKRKGIDPEKFVAGNENVLYPKWERKWYLGGIKEYDRLEKAKEIDVDAAECSASWGMFQIMGFNYKQCGCKSVTDFVEIMCKSEKAQLECFAQFIQSNHMEVYLQRKDWAGFARHYNGPGYEQNRYDEKLEHAYNKYCR